MTQGSVSNALRRLPETHNPGPAFDELVRDYPGPGGQSCYWWSSSPVSEQAQYLADRGALLSGDFAADRIAPWRMPERVVAMAQNRFWIFSCPVSRPAWGRKLSAVASSTACQGSALHSLAA